MEKQYKSLCSQIAELLELEKHSDSFNKVFVFCLEHLCLQTSIKDFHRKLSSAVEFKNLEITPSKFRLAISKSGYILLNLRFHTIHMATYSSLDDTLMEYYMFQHDVDLEDSACLTLLFNQRLLGRVSLKSTLRKKFKRKDRELYAPEQVQAIVEEFSLMIPEVKSHILRTIHKRLRFIMKTYNMTRDEFISELLFSAIRAHYRSKPNTFEYEKSVNIVRSSINNAAINIIKAYTTNKRERLVNEGQDSKGDNVFSLKVVSENQMDLRSVTGDDVDIGYDSMFSASFRCHQEKRRDIEFSVDQLCTRYGMRSKRSRLIRVFFKQDCWMFNRWLINNKFMRSNHKTTQDFIDSKTQDELLDILAQYLQTTADHLRTKALPGMAKALDLI